MLKANLSKGDCLSKADAGGTKLYNSASDAEPSGHIGSTTITKGPIICEKRLSTLDRDANMSGCAKWFCDKIYITGQLGPEQADLVQLPATALLAYSVRAVIKVLNDMVE